LAARACLYGRAVKVVDVVIEDDVDTAGGEILLDPLAILVGVARVEKLCVRVDHGDCFVGERVLELARIF
jgi:hypothetical protein